MAKDAEEPENGELDNLPLGMGLGIAIGIGIGAAMGRH